MTYHNYIAVIGRRHGDDEDSCLMYEQTTIDAAQERFCNDMRDSGDSTGGPSGTEDTASLVYVTRVLTSTAPMVDEGG